MEYTKNRKRIAIFSSEDTTWALPTWISTIPILLQNYDVVGLYVFPDLLGKMTGLASYFWYLRVFGVWNFFVMGVYALKVRLKLIISPIRTWKELARVYDLQLNFGSTPNSKTVAEWTKENKIDVIFIMVGNILKKEIIDSPEIGIINKHAAILPGCKGIFPYFWGKLTNSPLGITFHQVDTGIDTGEILLQVMYPDENKRQSMLRFYIDVFNLYPHLARLAANKLINQEYSGPLVDVKPSYFSLPQKSNYKNFRKKSNKIASISDIFYCPNIYFDETTQELRRD